MIIKSKITALALAGSLVAGGAVAGASVPSFSDFIQEKADSFIVKAAGWAGYSVFEHGKQSKAGVEQHVQKESDAATGETLRHFNSSVTGGKDAVSDHAGALKAEITTSYKEVTDKAKAEITSAVDEEVKLTNADVEAAAKAKAEALLNEAGKNVPNPPKYR